MYLIDITVYNLMLYKKKSIITSKYKQKSRKPKQGIM